MAALTAHGPRPYQVPGEVPIHRSARWDLLPARRAGAVPALGLRRMGVAVQLVSPSAQWEIFQCRAISPCQGKSPVRTGFCSRNPVISRGCRRGAPVEFSRQRPPEWKSNAEKSLLRASFLRLSVSACCLCPVPRGIARARAGLPCAGNPGQSRARRGKNPVLHGQARVLPCVSRASPGRVPCSRGYVQ